jgi:hypothetical protein
VLLLQRRIGNRAVATLLRETDPRLAYTAEVKAEGVMLDALSQSKRAVARPTAATPWATPTSRSGRRSGPSAAEEEVLGRRP